jgi:hypothetical protein
MARLIAPAPAQPAGADELLPIEEASRRMGVSKDYLYRHGAELPFTRRVGRKLLFSSLGIERYIQNDSLTARRHVLPLLYPRSAGQGEADEE